MSNCETSGTVERNHLMTIASRFPGKRILLLGDVMLDEYLWGHVSRISPEAPVPVVEVRRRSYVSGGAANTAANVASLGGRAVLAGVVGDDPAGDRLRSVLQQQGVDVSGILIDTGRPTTSKTRIIAHEQQVVRVDAEHRGGLSDPQEDALARWFDEKISGADACVISDYAKGVISNRLSQRIINAARASVVPVVVDPKPVDFGKYRGATVVKPNLLEAERICGFEIDDEERLVSAGKLMTKQLEGSSVMITRGSQGVSLFQAGQQPIHIAALRRQVFDVTGAGDTVAGALAMALAAGASLEEAAHLGNRCAAIVVGKVGTHPVSLDELLLDRD